MLLRETITILFILYGVSNAQERKRIFFPVEEKPPEPPCLTYDNQQGTCRLIYACSNSFSVIAYLSRSPCQITEDQQGICCPPIKAPTYNPSEVLENFVEVKNVAIQFPEVTRMELDSACEESLRNQTFREIFQTDLANKNVLVDRDSAAFFHARLFETDDSIIQRGKDGNVALETSKQISIKFNLNDDQRTIGLPNLNLKESILKNSCPTKPPCSRIQFKYRTANGTCNNIENEFQGSKGVALKRMLRPAYHDNLSTMRKAKDSRELPPARLVSSTVSPAISDKYQNFTILIWQWGQFLDHDITHTPISKGANGNDVSCCLNGRKRDPSQLDPECAPIDIPSNDPFYSQFGQKCLEFVRSMPAMQTTCSLGHREQMNQITSYIDGSNVYGSDDKAAASLREFRGGRLKTQKIKDQRDLLPANQKDKACPRMSSRACFLAGDSRVNEQVDLALMHTIWVRQHNQICEELARLNPGWSDEILYQEARKIVGAQMQHITYNEYLPIVLGDTVVNEYGLLPQRDEYFTGYNPKADATILNPFTTAAFRYGHTLVNDNIQGFNGFGRRSEDLMLNEVQFRPFLLYNKEVFNNLVRGFGLQQSQKFDRFFGDQLSNKLFGDRFGMDLVALNIQRGRDHGLRPYIDYRKACNMVPVHSWDDLRLHMDDETIQKLKLVYRNVEDIDLFIGGISERVYKGSLVGETFNCILLQQFLALKIADRFYYENGGPRNGPQTLSSFTLGQLDEIRKTTLARILCDNSDIEMMQPIAFFTPHLLNKRALCSSDKLIPRTSLEPWKNSGIWS